MSPQPHLSHATPTLTSRMYAHTCRELQAPRQALTHSQNTSYACARTSLRTWLARHPARGHQISGPSEANHNSRSITELPRDPKVHPPSNLNMQQGRTDLRYIVSAHSNTYCQLQDAAKREPGHAVQDLQHNAFRRTVADRNQDSHTAIMTLPCITSLQRA
jgi:hypothetical protein